MILKRLLDRPPKRWWTARRRITAGHEWVFELKGAALLLSGHRDLGDGNRVTSDVAHYRRLFCGACPSPAVDWISLARARRLRAPYW